VCVCCFFSFLFPATRGGAAGEPAPLRARTARSGPAGAACCPQRLRRGRASRLPHGLTSLGTMKGSGRRAMVASRQAWSVVLAARRGCLVYPRSASAAEQCAPGAQPGLPRSCEVCGVGRPCATQPSAQDRCRCSAAAAARRSRSGPFSGLLLQVCSQCVSAGSSSRCIARSTSGAHKHAAVVAHKLQAVAWYSTLGRGSQKDMGRMWGSRGACARTCMTLVQAVALCCRRSGVQCTSSGGAWGLAWHAALLLCACAHSTAWFMLWLLLLFRREPLVSQASVAGAVQVDMPTNGMGACSCLVLRPKLGLGSRPQLAWRCGVFLAWRSVFSCITWSDCHTAQPASLVRRHVCSPVVRRGPLKRPAPCVRPGACKVRCMLTCRAPLHVSVVMACEWRCSGEW
jgi:hypothetical protein